MQFQTYRLYYETEIFDPVAFEDAFAATGDHEDADPGDCYRDVSACVAVIVANLPEGGEEQEVQLMMLRPSSLRAPEWYGPEEAELVAREIGRIIHTGEDGTVEIRDPQDPSFDLEVGAVVRARDFDEACLMAMDDIRPARPFGAFTIEYTPPGADSSFPVGLFIIDPLEGRMLGEPFGTKNQFAPPGFTRSERRMVDRRFATLTKKIESLRGSGGRTQLVRMNLARLMGPQFRTEGLPTITAADIEEAKQQAIWCLEQVLLPQE